MMLKIDNLINQLFNQEYRFLVPEVVQTSAMDCGPAALKSVLAGFNISADYGQLREVCQTDVDGTSIDTLEEISNQLGLVAEQILVPADHLLLPEMQSLPAIIVVKTAGGLPHFIVIWNKIGPLIQLMDPGTGRRWVNQKRLFEELYIHNHPLPITIWREWAGSEGFYNPLKHRLEKLATQPDNKTVNALLDSALQDETWYALATLDAATRMVETLVKTKGLKFGNEAINVLKQFFEQTLANPKNPYKIIPAPYWLVQLTDYRTEENEPILIMQGAVLVRIVGLKSTADITALTESEDETTADKTFDSESIFETTPKRPELEIFRLFREDGLLTPFVLLLALIIGAVSVVIQALLLNNILNISTNIAIFQNQLWPVIILFTFLLFLDIPISATILRMGRQLEIRFRITILEKIPKLGDRYFRSRLNSDIAQRIHEMRSLRTLPLLATQFLRIGFEIIFTTIGLIWFFPSVTSTIVLLMLWTFISSLISQPILAESDLRVQTHSGALSRFYLDALLGLVSIRSHSAEKAIRHEHENLLVSWAQASDRFDYMVIYIQAFNSLVSLAFVLWIVYTHVISQASVGNSLLLLYWLLNLPTLAQNLANIAQQYPLQRNRVLRLLDPLNAITEIELETETAQQTATKPQPSVAINLENVSVKASGQTILRDVNLAIKPGEHVAIVGLSGAGKSTLAGLLLGWHKTAAGRLLIDGKPLTPQRLSILHKETAWVDPAIQIWNKSLLNNLEYGHSDPIASDKVRIAIDQSDLFSVLQNLPNGQQTILGEGGGLVSGGEGQRVRLGRAILRNNIRLVILDEPFRGLGFEQRQTLLKKARQYWQNATFIFISHDIAQSQQFDRVIVIEDGAIVEIGSPATLVEQAKSRYNSLLKTWQTNQTKIWSATYWRQLWLDNQQLDEK